MLLLVILLLLVYDIVCQSYCQIIAARLVAMPSLSWAAPAYKSGVPGPPDLRTNISEITATEVGLPRGGCLHVSGQAGQQVALRTQPPKRKVDLLPTRCATSFQTLAMKQGYCAGLSRPRARLAISPRPFPFRRTRRGESGSLLPQPPKMCSWMLPDLAASAGRSQVTDSFPRRSLPKRGGKQT